MVELFTVVHQTAKRPVPLLLVAHLCLCLSAVAAPCETKPTRQEFLDLARSGWVFDLRASVRRRSASLPPVVLNSRDVVLDASCLIGEPPHPLARSVIDAFDRLLRHVYGQRQPFRTGGATTESCGAHQRVYLRLYSQSAGNAFNADIAYLDREYQIGLPRDRRQLIRAPAQAMAFFGRAGAPVHLLVMQPSVPRPVPLQTAFFKSILIEELFQAFTFGVDILKIDRAAPFRSKLQESPVNLRFLAWDSEDFMRGLVESNPRGLCAFDIFIMHALANSGLKTANSPEFLSYLSRDFDALLVRTRATLAAPDFATLTDPSCAGVPD